MNRFRKVGFWICFILISGIACLAQSDTTALLQSADLRADVAILNPTGGSQRGINGGAFFFLRLPHSGIEMDMPLIGTFPPQALPDAGVTPDIMVTLTPFDIANQRDPELAAARTFVSEH